MLQWRRRPDAAVRAMHRFFTNSSCCDYKYDTLTSFVAYKNNRIEIGPPSAKILQEAVRMVVERLFEPRFADQSFGCRPGSGRQIALKQISSTWWGMEWYLQFHLISCLKSLEQERLTASLGTRIGDQGLIDLIRMLCYYSRRPVGIHRNILASLLCNIYLDSLDREVQRVMQENTTLRAKRRDQEHTIKVKYIRYLDQFVVGVHGSEMLVCNLKKQILVFLNTQLKLKRIYCIYENITCCAPQFLGIRVKVRGHDIVRSYEKSMEKRRRGKRRIILKRMHKEFAFENKVGFLFQQAWLSNAKRALLVAGKTSKQILATEKPLPGEQFASLYQLVRDFFSTRAPAAQNKYMIRKHLNC